MTKLRSLEALRMEVEKLRSSGKKIALANGVFDLLHVGHLRYLQGAKTLADTLIVAVNSNASARASKGPGRPIVPDEERAELLCALMCVDYVTVFDGPDVRPIIQAIKPDIHVKGTDYTPESIPERDEVLAYGGTVAVAGDPKNHSTTAALELLRKSW